MNWVYLPPGEMANVVGLEPVGLTNPFRTRTFYRMNEPVERSARIMDVPLIRDSRGTIGVLQGENLPFKVERTFFISEVPEGKTRGGHAHRVCHELIVPVNGSAEIVLDDGQSRRRLQLASTLDSDTAKAAYIPPGIWMSLEKIAPGTVIFVLASHPFDPSDYLDVARGTYGTK